MGDGRDAVEKVNVSTQLDIHSRSGAVVRAARFLLQIRDATARDGTRGVPAEVARRSRSRGPGAGKETRAAQRVHVARAEQRTAAVRAEV